MGSINLTSLKNVDKVERGATYVDLHLDVEQSTVPTKFTNDTLQGKDIRVDYDEKAVMNSLNNLFSTIPGERFLVPRFGANLRRYLFSPVTEYTARQIGNEIVEAIERWEPRVTVELVSVTGYPENPDGMLDEHTYNVDIRLTINAIRRTVTFNGILNRNTDILIQNVDRTCPTE
jgi:phage baseplate assembly protein W